MLPDSPSSSSCSSRRVRQLSLSALVYSFLPGATGPADSSKPGRPTSRRSGFSKRRSPLGGRRDNASDPARMLDPNIVPAVKQLQYFTSACPSGRWGYLPVIPALAAMYLSHAAAETPLCLLNTSLVESTFATTPSFYKDRSFVR